ncbi:hypothetical protein D8M34_06605 [Microbacterium sp. HSID17254]|nr:hypothetical protein D8M34_06605 [Microbacterium sp. HSID17254]
MIAKQRAELAVVKTQAVEVVAGGERVELEFEKLLPDEWDALVASNPPRRGVEGDAMVGYNPKGLASAYPRVRVSGEDADAESWAELYSVLDSVWRNTIEVSIWGMNVNSSLQALRDLGKAQAGQS